MIKLNTSVQDIKLHVSHELKNNHLTVHNLNDAIAREKKGKNRSSIINYLAARANELTTKDPSAPTDQKTIDGKAELVGADWTLARQLFTSIKLHLRLSLAGQVFLGHELERLKKELGFKGRGRPQNNSADSAELTWEQYLEKEMPDLKRRPADIFIQLYQAARTKLKKLGHTKALALLDKPSSQLTAPQLKQLETFTDKITHGETQASLLEELKIAKAKKKKPSPGNGDDDSEEEGNEEENEDAQLAFAFFGSPFKTFAGLRYEKHYQHHLASMPLQGDPDQKTVGLIDMQEQLTATLADIKKMIETQTKKNKTSN